MNNRSVDQQQAIIKKRQVCQTTLQPTWINIQAMQEQPQSFSQKIHPKADRIQMKNQLLRPVIYCKKSSKRSRI